MMVIIKGTNQELSTQHGTWFCPKQQILVKTPVPARVYHKVRWNLQQSLFMDDKSYTPYKTPVADIFMVASWVTSIFPLNSCSHDLLFVLDQNNSYVALYFGCWDLYQQ